MVVKIIKKLSQKFRPVKFRLIFLAAIILLSDVAIVLQPFLDTKTYALGNAEDLLTSKNTELAQKLNFDTKNRVFTFTSTPAAGESATTTPTSGIKATLNDDISKGITVVDPTNNVQFGITPRNQYLTGKKDGNRVVYPMQNGRGWTVFTAQTTGIKEDVILTSSLSDTATLSYDMALGESLAARLENDGSIGVYGNTVLSGSITAASDADAKLLASARQNAQKNTLLFTIPKPTILEKGKGKTSVIAKYVLDGSSLKVVVSGLSNATYPLSIDPTIYVATAQQFMSGNNETNINFNVAQQLIEKGRTTGARFNSWNSTTALPTPNWSSGNAAAGGYAYSAGGITFQGQIFNSQGAGSFLVPTGVTSLTLKLWGGAGGGGGGGSTAAGAPGGSGGYITSTIAVTPGETLSAYVGGAGSGGTYSGAGSGAGGGGGGGGFTSIYRGATALAIASGGGGGGGGRATLAGGGGGSGGGTSGINGTAGGTTTSGSGGTATTGGSGGVGNTTGVTGGALTGGDGGDGRSTASTGSGVSGGATAGGNGGSANLTSTRGGGGGGGSGFFGGGGGGGSASTTTVSGSGGGGGSSYTVTGSTGVTNTPGSGATPANSADTMRNGAGTGGTAGAALANGTTGTGGIAILSYGAGTATTTAVNWAQFNTSTGTIDSANPGNGACSGWCTSSAYSLPAARSNFSLVAYSGYLYAFGGLDSTGAPTNSVYIAKLGANGEPRLWHPTSTNPASWVYWYQDTSISSVRSDMAVAAYNNRMYLVGGRAGTTTYANTTEIANINPNGTLGTWATGTSLPTNVYGHSLKIYNDRMYVIGGASSITSSPSSVIQYTKINSDGTINNWVSAGNNMPTGRMNSGGDFATIWGAYLYISGGCAAINTSGYCTSVQSNTQVASINADGSLDTWSTIAGVNDTRTGGSLLAWRGYVYEIGGCSTQNTTTGDCNSGILSTINYGTINQDGDASTVGQSVPSGTGTCTGVSPIGCNLPGTAYIGNMLNSSFITNGYLYVVGGCTDNPCTATLGNVAYVAISSTGQMSKPATCPTGTYQGGTWCVDSTNTIPGGIAAASPVIFNNRVYLVGGLNGNTNTNAIVRANINNDGSLSAWSSQTMTSTLGVNSVSYLFAYVRANPSTAATVPGNLYIFGGCANSSAAGCTAYSQNVYKCNIQVAGTIAGCTTTGQLQIGIIPGDTASGLGIMSGTVYANYIYLIGGVSPNQVDLKTVRYAKFDNNNNIITAGSGWTESANKMAVGRRRAAAFGYNGYIYVVGGYEASTGVLADIEFIKVNVSDGSIGSATSPFNVSAVTISQRWGLSVPVSNSYAYVIGGCISGASPGGCANKTDVIQTFQIYNNDSGAPAGYTTSANTWAAAPNRVGASSIIQNGYIYTAAGCTSTTDCTNAVSDVSYAQIDVNGNIGAWAQATAGLPAVRTNGKLLSAAGTLYYVGGQSSTSTDQRAEVYYATPNGTGNITAWTAATNGLPAARSDFGATVWNNQLYVVGGAGTGAGCTASNVCNTVYVSPTLTGGNIATTWSTVSTPFNIARSGGTAVAYANNLYVMGGYDGANYLGDVQYSKISPSDGSSGSWVFTASLPGPLAGSSGFATNGYLYLVGGRSNATTCNPITAVAPISANTTITSGNNPTGIGEWYVTNQRYTGARYGASAVYNDGKAYVLGGACGTTLTYASPVIQQTVILAQPQVAKYSYAIDTDSDVYPAYWLLNGIDNAIGAKWQLRYRSMTNPSSTICSNPAMTTWGSETVFGNVTLGLPGVYIPKNGLGTNTKCARYYYFNVSVDSSQAFGYPDDVTRGPTITNLTLQFTSDPSKRLIHGKTFTGGLQQPIDSPLYSF